MENPERFDPSDAAGTLIDSEHRARYHFGAQVVDGESVLDASCGVGYGIEILSRAGAVAVTGVDISPEAVAEAKSRFGKFAEALVQADLRDLPLDDDSFDVVVSFETIEHVKEPEKALAELRRVLKPDGVLVISSPNPDAYVGGNEHHVHEYRPEELRTAVGAIFKNVVGFRQDAWLGSSVHEAGADPALEILRATTDEDEPPYSLVIASDSALPQVSGVLAVGGTYDVRWWSEQLDHSRAETMQAIEREKSAERKLTDTSEALLEANRELARVPVLEHRLATLEARHGDLVEQYHEVLGSTSWRVTAPLRRRSG
jgi:SAM-dependent methyltransferase